jgi:tetratricopeptide (TPR) repeat protein
MGRVLAVFLLITTSLPSLFGQAPDQKQYSDAVNTYEKIPPAQRTAESYNRLGIAYHFLNQLKAAEKAYQNALRLKPDS